ncbi:MAG: hypothetical protein EOM56_13135 [Deltaproteobacteria bacterium]|nr:hypothetical protein [Deltaproteobacteria bacterium]
MAPRLRNAMAQALLHASGQQVFRASTADYFNQLGVADEGVCQLAAEMGVPPAQLVARADSLITRRNAMTHPGSLEALDAEVAEVLACVTPALERMCAWECRFLKAYGAMKGAFPERFH